MQKIPRNSKADEAAMRYSMEALSNATSTIDDILTDSREKSLAITKLQEAEMWTKKAIESGNHRIEVGCTPDAGLQAL